MKPIDEEIKMDTIENRSEINERNSNNHGLKNMKTETRSRQLEHLANKSQKVHLKLLL